MDHAVIIATRIAPTIGAAGHVTAINQNPAEAASTIAKLTAVTITGSLRYQRFRVSAMPAIVPRREENGKVDWNCRRPQARCDCGLQRSKNANSTVQTRRDNSSLI